MEKAGKTLCLVVAILISITCDFALAKAIYVDDSTSGTNNGSSWINAYNNLQDALNEARYTSGSVEIRVAQGTYRPDRGFGQQPGDREATFGLLNNVALFGGYAGHGSSDPDARNIELYETILSGDLQDNDMEVASPADMAGNLTRAENCYHVVTANGTGATAVLDGFTITAGQDDRKECFEEGPDIICMCMAYGAGIYNDGGSPTIRNCKIEWNSAYTVDFHMGEAYGGGMFNKNNANPALSNCTFAYNYANDGGGLSNKDSHPILNECTFIHNSSDFQGAAIGNDQANPELIDCVITYNDTRIGGAISSMWSNTKLTGCTISNNSGSNRAGAIYQEEGTLSMNDCVLSGNTGGNGGALYICTTFGDAETSVQNCVFRGNTGKNGGAIHTDASRGEINLEISSCLLVNNSVTGKGGALYTYGWLGEAMLNVNHCTINGNSASQGGAVHNQQATNGNGSVDVGVMNSILWGNTPDEIRNSGNIYFAVAWSDVKGGWSGQFNMDSDPAFVDPPGDNWHLKSQAGRWDTDSESWIQDDVTSPCIDAGYQKAPIGFEPFPNGGIVNLGAYGGTNKASKSYFGAPVCETIIAGDINGDCQVDYTDFALMAIHWLKCYDL